jgi:hypothetical protein
MTSYQRIVLQTPNPNKKISGIALGLDLICFNVSNSDLKLVIRKVSTRLLIKDGKTVSARESFFPELNEPAARPASRDASRPAPGGASAGALRTERRRRIEDSAATYLPGLAAADSS